MRNEKKQNDNLDGEMRYIQNRRKLAILYRRKKIFLWITIAILVLLTSFGITLNCLDFVGINLQEIQDVISAVTIIIALTAALITYYYRKEFEKIKTNEWQDVYTDYLHSLLNEIEISEDENKDNTADKDVPSTSTLIPESTSENIKKNDNRDVIAMMLKNYGEITEYFKISKSQAKSSYRLSVISCVFGVVILGIAIYAVTVIKDIELTIIGIVAGAIVEVVSGTVLWVHNKSALQLNHYYDALHENEKFLSAVNIADKLSDVKREEMYIEIIKTQINIKNK